MKTDTDKYEQMKKKGNKMNVKIKTKRHSKAEGNEETKKR